MSQPLISELSQFIDKFAPMIILFVVGVLILNNLKDMIIQYFIGVGIKWNRQINEFDIFEINNERCILVKINSFRLYFLALEADGSLKKKLITIGNKTFVTSRIVKIGKFI